MRRVTLIILLLAWLGRPPGAAEAQDWPGFAVGCFDNGNHYEVGQLLTVTEAGSFSGFEVFFGLTAGRPTGQIRWEMRRLGRPEPSLAGLLSPMPGRPNVVQVDSTPVDAGIWVLTFRSVEEQQRGNYWNILASPPGQGSYDGGDLIQREPGGPWHAWTGQDLALSIDLTTPTHLWTDLRADPPWIRRT